MTKNLLRNSAKKTTRTPKSNTRQKCVKTSQKMGFAVMGKSADSRMDIEKSKETNK
jgi:hypothetical protein